MRKLFSIFMLIATAACSQKADKPDAIVFLTGKALGEVTHPKLDEISGMAASVNNPGLLWVHNDSGNSAEIFLVDSALNIKLTCHLKGAFNRDWEGIALGPGPEVGKMYLYVGDIGDNFAIFQYKNIYRFQEPVLQNNKSTITVAQYDTITFQLADGRKDTEALFIHPRTKDLYIISKREEPVYLYSLKYPHSTKDTLTASKVIPLPFSQIVAADFSTDGKEIIIKNYRNVYYWKTEGRKITDVLRERPYILEYEKEPQGEAIAFALDGSGYYTISEKTRKDKSFLKFYARRKRMSR